MARNTGGSTPAAPAGARDSGSTVLAAKRVSTPSNDFDNMRRRVVRTRMTNGGLTFNTDDRPKQGYKNITAALNRARAFKTYSQQGGRPLNELTGDKLRAPYGRFSTIKNPAPAKAFPSQAPGRTKAGELVAREARKAAKTNRRR